MFSLRHLPLCALLLSCSVYDESLLDDAEGVARGGAASNATGGGSGGSNAGQPSGGSSAAEPGHGGEPSQGDSGSAGASSGGGGTASGGTGNGAGGSSVSGAGSSGSAGSGGVVSPPSGADLVDDMEDGNFYLAAKPPRYGYWYVAGDATAGAKLPKIEQLVASFAPARDTSFAAVHFLASGFKGWGASVGLTFADSAQKRAPYDSGDALGISFWVRGSMTDNSKLRVLFPVLGTDPSGTECGGTGQGQCLDHFATQLAVTDKWEPVTILFASLHQAGWGAPLGGFDPANMLGIEWTTAGADADVWIDDLALLRP